jgi:hypothetical protein
MYQLWKSYEISDIKNYIQQAPEDNFAQLRDTFREHFAHQVRSDDAMALEKLMTGI